jgi:hypothetical protein
MIFTIIATLLDFNTYSTYRSDINENIYFIIQIVDLTTQILTHTFIAPCPYCANYVPLNLIAVTCT